MRTYRRFLENYQRGTSRLNPAVIITAVFLVGMVLLMFLQSTGQPRVEHQIEVIQITQQVAQTYDQPWLVSTDDVTVYVPANSLETDGTISIARAEQNQFQVSADTWTRLRTVVIEFLDTEGRPVPDFSFLNRVEVCFRLTEEQWQDFEARPGAYQVQHYRVGQDSQAWEALPLSTYEENLELCGLTFSLSAFSLAVQPADSQIPITGPTVISVLPPTSSIPRQLVQPYPTKVRVRPTSTPRLPTSTPVRPTNTPAQPTVIVVQPTNTQVQPTQPPPTRTPVPPPTRTPIIILPTFTFLPPPATTQPPPPTATTAPPPTAEATDPPTEVPTEPSNAAPTEPPTQETPSGVIDSLLGLVFLLSLRFLR